MLRVPCPELRMKTTPLATADEKSRYDEIGVSGTSYFTVTVKSCSNWFKGGGWTKTHRLNIKLTNTQQLRCFYCHLMPLGWILKCFRIYGKCVDQALINSTPRNRPASSLCKGTNLRKTISRFLEVCEWVFVNTIIEDSHMIPEACYQIFAGIRSNFDVIRISEVRRRKENLMNSKVRAYLLQYW